MIPYTFGLDTGTLYTGEQTTTTGYFKIDMTIDKLMFDESLICGTFTIYDLTPKIKTIKTYFEGQFIGEKYSFQEKEDDVFYWARFHEWRYKFLEFPKLYDPKTSKHLYIKIKEMFLLPESRNSEISCASIDGYYYCCYHKRSDCFSGFYQVSDACKHGTQEVFLLRSNERTSQSCGWI